MRRPVAYRRRMRRPYDVLRKTGYALAMHARRVALAVLVLLTSLVATPATQQTAPPKLAAYKTEAAASIDGMYDFAQQMVDSVFSFGELGLPGVRDAALSDRHPREGRLHDSARHRRHPDGVDGAIRIGQAGDRAGLRHRLHPAGVAEARRRLPRADHRRRARARRRAQLRRAAQHRRGDRREADHAAREAARHARAVAGRRRRTARDEGVLRARRRVQGRGRRPLQPRRHQPLDRLGRQRAATASCRSSTRSRANRRTAATRRGADAARWTRWS